MRTERQRSALDVRDRAITERISARRPTVSSRSMAKAEGWERSTGWAATKLTDNSTHEKLVYPLRAHPVKGLD